MDLCSLLTISNPHEEAALSMVSNTVSEILPVGLWDGVNLVRGCGEAPADTPQLDQATVSGVLGSGLGEGP